MTNAKSLFFLVTLALAPGLALCHEVPFEKTIQVFQENGQAKERAVALVYDDDKLMIRDRADKNGEKQTYHDIPYAAITTFRYAHAAAPPGQAAGSASATAEPRHWLAIHCLDGGKESVVLLVLDPEEAENAVGMAGILTGKEVEQ
jgi:hypothetical protein